MHDCFSLGIASQSVAGIDVLQMAAPEDADKVGLACSRVPRGIELKRRGMMRRKRRQMACIGVLAAMLCLWTVVAHAITLNVTDDTFTQKDRQTTISGSATSLDISSTNLTKEHITYVLFDLSPLGVLPSTKVVDTAMLRLFVNTVATAANGSTISLYEVTAGSLDEQTLTWNNT